MKKKQPVKNERSRRDLTEQELGEARGGATTSYTNGGVTHEDTWNSQR